MTAMQHSLTPQSAEATPQISRGRNIRRKLALGLSSILAVAILGVALFGIYQHYYVNAGSDGTATTSSLPPATYTISTATLSQSQTVEGILSRGDPVPLTIQAKEGVLTWVAEPGTVVKLGQPVYEIDGLSVVLIHGSVPPYRPLQQGFVGDDVLQFEQSLTALGYTGFVVDDLYNWETANAVYQWQKDLGVAETGIVEFGQIVVAEDDIRIASNDIAIGSQLGSGANQVVAMYQQTTQFVSVPLDVNLQHLVKQGNSASINLPDGSVVDGKVSKVGKVLLTIEEKNFINVEVTVKDQAALERFEASPVTIELETGRVENVLTVPVNALVALAGGGYGLEVVANGQTSFVAVTTGLFAGGMVEVEGSGISEGTVVGVAT